MASVADSPLEAELARQLCAVRAPDSLWRAIHEQRRPLRVRPHWWKAWWAAAALSVLLAGLAWRLGAARNAAPDQTADLEALAERELGGMADGSAAMDIRSGDPGEIRRWLKANTGVDVRLADSPAPGHDVRLVGAGLAQFGKSPVAVVAYRAGDDFAAMVVADRREGPGHASPRMEVSGDVSLYSWQLGADDYAIAFGGRKQPWRACLICHADPAVLMRM
jgi:hypothetical protein